MTLKHYIISKQPGIFTGKSRWLKVTLNSYTREADPLLFISVNSSVLRWPCLGVEEGREGRSYLQQPTNGAVVITKITKPGVYGVFLFVRYI